MLGKRFSRRHFKIFFLIFPRYKFVISCKLSPEETICTECQTLFSGKVIIIIIKIAQNLSSAVLAQRMVKFNSFVLYGLFLLSQIGVGSKPGNTLE